MLDHLNVVDDINDIKPGQLLVIQRKQDNRRILVKAKKVLSDEIVLSNLKNDYFNFDMYKSGKSWVWRVWALPVDVEITSITNNLIEFPR